MAVVQCMLGFHSFAVLLLTLVIDYSRSQRHSIVFSPVIVQEFRGLQDVTIRHAVLPAAVWRCQWHFLSDTEPHSHARNFTIFLTQGKLPMDVLSSHVISHVENSPIQTPDGAKVYVVQGMLGGSERGAEVANLRIERPFPGRWYALVAFLKPEVTDDEYKLNVVLEWEMSRDLPTLHPEHHSKATLTPRKPYQIFRISTMTSSRRLVISLSECLQTSANVSLASMGCSRDVFIRASGISATTISPGTSYFRCPQTDACAVEEVLDGGKEYFATVLVSSWTSNITTATFEILMDTVECQLQHISEDSTEVSCAKEASFGEYPLNVLNTSYYYRGNDGYINVTNSNLEPGGRLNILHVHETPLAYHFRLDELFHAGGTLHVSVQVADQHHPDTVLTKRPYLEPQLIEVCLQQSAVTGSHPSQNCLTPFRGLLHPTTTHTGNWTLTWSLPYPMTGSWFLVTRKRCLEAPLTRFVYKYQAISEERLDVVRCVHDTVLHVEVKVTACPGDCGAHGTCETGSQQGLTYGYCLCHPGWRSVDCSQQDPAWPQEGVVLPTALLAGSSLFLLPAIILCLMRRHLTEAVVYCFTMFMSAMHHACESSVPMNPRACVLSYLTLTELDIFASMLSFWATLILVANLKEKWRPLAYVCCSIFLVLVTRMECNAVFVYIVPAAIGISLVLGGWIVKTCRWGGLTHSRRTLVRHVAGAVLAAIGTVLLCVADSPPAHVYVHSAWHLLMAFSVILFIPDRRRWISLGLPGDDDRSNGPGTFRLAWAKALCLKLSLCCPQNKDMRFGYRVCSTAELETTDHVLLSDDLGGQTEYSIRTAAAI